MNKQESAVLKGIAILFMLFLHLFHHPEEVNALTNYIYIHDTPVTSYLVRLTDPVFLFLLISGYGLYCAFQSSRMSLKSNLLRAGKLYVHYWIVMIVFMLCSSLILGSAELFGGLDDMILNITGIDTTYNFVGWFLLPYCIAMIMSVIWCKAIRKWPRLTFGIALFGGYAVIVVIFKYIVPNNLYENNLIRNTVQALNFSCVMVVGAVFAHYKIIERFKSYFAERQFLLAILLLAVLIGRMSTTSAVFHREYIFLFVPLVMAIRRPAIVTKVLTSFGRRSTTMWFCHTFFCYYIFRDFIYSFSHPFLIFLVLVALSYAVAVILDPVVAKVRGFIFDSRLPAVEKA